MLLGKSRPKISMSYSTRKIRLSVAHHGAPSAWTAPAKDERDLRAAPPAKKRR